jgi:hypothetical protein
MPHEVIDDALQDATAIANAILSRKHDPVQTACNLAVFAVVIAGEDQIAKIALAQTMLQYARELDPDLVGACWH